jgi:zinc protease
MLVYLSRLLTVFFLIFTSNHIAYANAEIKIQRITDRIYLVPDAKAKTIDFQMIVNAGCYDEANNNCLGLAHYLEHIILIGRNSGSTDIAFRFFPEAYANGWTNNQATAYVHKVPLKGGAPEPILEKLFDFYSKRLTGFDISAKDAERERQIVQQEYDWRYGSKPESLFLLEASALEIPQHPHDQTAAGTPASIAVLTIDQAKAFHERWYSKDNVSFVITGNIEPEKLQLLAANALKDVTPRPVPSHDWTKILSYKNETIIKRGKDKQTARTQVYMSKIIKLDDKDEYKTQAVQNILYGFLASKLTNSPYSVLVERELVASDVSVSIHKRVAGVYEFDITATLADDVPQAKLIEAITRYTNQLSTLQLSEATLERLKKRYADSWQESLNNADQVTSRLVGWLARDLKYDELQNLPERVASVNLTDIAAQTRAISAEGRVIFGVLEPDLTPVESSKKGNK